MKGDDLRALLGRLESATGPDREIDALLWCVENDRDPIWRDGMLMARAKVQPFDEAYIGCEWGGAFKDVGPFSNPTASLDAAVALVERAEPDLEWLVRPDKRRGGFANLSRPDLSPNEGHPCWPAYGATPPIALCISLVLVRIALTEPSPDA